MTRSEYELTYATRMGMSVRQLHEQGEYAVPCSCGHDQCPGWQIMSGDDIQALKEICRVLLDRQTPSKAEHISAIFEHLKQSS